MISDGRGSTISDHALLRFMQRVVHVDIDEFEYLMLERLRKAEDMGDGWLIGADGEHYLCGHEGSVITVLDAHAGRQARGHKARAKRNHRK